MVGWGAERAAFLTFRQLRALGKDVDIYSDVEVSGESERVYCLPRRSFVDVSAAGLFHDYDGVLIHHHIEPILAFRLAKTLKRVYWYSGSIFEPVYSKQLYGQDYQSISLSFKETAENYYGLLGKIGYFGFPLFSRVFRIADNSTVRSYEKLIANSQWQRKWIRKIYNQDACVVYPPIEDFSSYPSVKISIDRPYVLMVGNFSPLKNFSSGLMAMRGITDRYAAVLVGTGCMEQEYRRVARELGLNLYIFNEPDQALLGSLYERASFVLHPSLFEGFGLVPVEAALHRKPSIITTRSGVIEILPDGASSFHCDPYDLTNLTRLTHKLAEDEELRVRMGNSAYEDTYPYLSTSSSQKLWECLES